MAVSSYGRWVPFVIAALLVAALPRVAGAQSPDLAAAFAYNPARLTITQPAGGASIDGDRIDVAYTIAGDSTGVDHVHVILDGGTALEDSSLDGVFQLTVAGGAHVIAAVLARADHSPLDGTAAAAVSFETVLPDRTAPVIALTIPGAGEAVANTVTVMATATDDEGVRAAHENGVRPQPLKRMVGV